VVIKDFSSVDIDSTVHLVFKGVVAGYFHIPVLCARLLCIIDDSRSVQQFALLLRFHKDIRGQSCEKTIFGTSRCAMISTMALLSAMNNTPFDSPLNGLSYR
jgi:hypothetical protein